MNKNLECIEINWSVLGAQLANLSNDEQAPFFKAFACEMTKYPSFYQTQMQITYIRKTADLTNEERKIFTELGEPLG